jgi:hypothetical protein
MMNSECNNEGVQARRLRELLYSAGGCASLTLRILGDDRQATVRFSCRAVGTLVAVGQQPRGIPEQVDLALQPFELCLFVGENYEDISHQTSTFGAPVVAVLVARCLLLPP